MKLRGENALSLYLSAACQRRKVNYVGASKDRGEDLVEKVLGVNARTAGRGNE
jgi:hypothetical protein